MRLSRSVMGILSLSVASAWAGPPEVGMAPGVQIVRGTAIAEKIESAAPSPGGRGGVIAQDEGWRVHVAEREAPGLAEQHAADTDVWYVLAGAATLATGGTLVDPSVTGPGEERAPAIRGGSEVKIAAGDLITIRPGVPHWVKAVDGRRQAH